MSAANTWVYTPFPGMAIHVPIGKTIPSVDGVNYVTEGRPISGSRRNTVIDYRNMCFYQDGKWNFDPSVKSHIGKPTPNLPGWEKIIDPEQVLPSDPTPERLEYLATHNSSCEGSMG